MFGVLNDPKNLHRQARNGTKIIQVQNRAIILAQLNRERERGRRMQWREGVLAPRHA